MEEFWRSIAVSRCAVIIIIITIFSCFSITNYFYYYYYFYYFTTFTITKSFWNVDNVPLIAFSYIYQKQCISLQGLVLSLGMMA